MYTNKISNEYSSKKLKTVFLPDGANKVVNHNKSAVEISDAFTTLVDKCLVLFEPDFLVFYELIPFKKAPEKNIKNKTNDELNNLLGVKFKNNDTVQVLKLSGLITDKPTFCLKIAHYYEKYYDILILKNKIGIPYFRKALLGHLLNTFHGITQSHFSDKTKSQRKVQ